MLKKEVDKTFIKNFFYFFLIIFLIRVFLAQFLNIIPDEAYYWTWSNNLDWCYYDQPGMIAWVEHLGNKLPGNINPLSARLPLIILSLGATFLVFLVSLELFESKMRAFYVAVLLNLTPMFFAGAFLVMHDGCLLFFWILTIFFLVKLVKTGNEFYLFMMAIALAGTIYSKFTGVFMAFGILLFFIVSPKQRKWLTSPGFWTAGLLAFLFILPIITWNYQNDWISYKVVSKLAGKHPSSIKKVLDYFFSYHGAQFLLISPLLFIPVVVTQVIGVKKWLKKKDDYILLCLVFSLPVLLYFSFQSFFSRVQPNWSVFAYPMAFVFMVEEIGRNFKKEEKKFFNKFIYWQWAVGIAAVTCLILVVHATVSFLPPNFEGLMKKDRLVKEFRGWPELAEEVRSMRKPGQVVMALRYQIASELEFYLADQPFVYCMNAFGRGNQYDFTNDYDALGGMDVLLVSEKPIPEDLAEKFHEVEPPVTFNYSYKKVIVKTFLIYQCHNFDHSRGRPLDKRKHF